MVPCQYLKETTEKDGEELFTWADKRHDKGKQF